MKKNNSNKVKLGASDKIVRGFGYVVVKFPTKREKTLKYAL